MLSIILKTTIMFLVLLGSGASAKPNSKSRYSFKKNINMGMFLSFWQQDIAVGQVGQTGVMRMGYRGLGLSINYLQWSSKPGWVFGLDNSLTVGQAKGEAKGAVAVKFGSQNFSDLQLAPIVVYRVSPIVEFGLYYFAGYRWTFWQPEKGVEVNVSDGSLFYHGYGIKMVHHVSQNSSLVVKLSHQMSLESTRWDIGWQRRW